MSKLKKYTDWRTWWDGLRTNLLKCLGVTGTAFLTSNGLAATIPALKGIAIDWKAALLFFAAHLGKEFFDYVKENQPKVVEEAVETTFTSKDVVTGQEITQTSKTVTTTPVAPAQPQDKPNV